MMLNFPKSKPFQLSLAYTVAYGFMVPLGNARFWDDWSSQSLAGVEFLSGQVFPFREFLDEQLIHLSGGFWLYRPLTFLLFAASGLFVWQILGVCRGLLDESDRMWVTALFLLLPFNSVRAIVQSLFSYTLSHFFFFAAWSVIVAKRQLYWALIALAMFVVSFPTNSLLFYVLLPAFHVLLVSEFSLRNRVLRFCAMGVASVSYRPFSRAIWPDLRLNEGYNEIRGAFLVRSIVVFLILLFICLVILLRLVTSPDRQRKPLVLICLGVLAFATGLFPYMAVGHFPNFSDLIIQFIPNESEMDSRHGLLLPLGTALIVVGLVRLLVLPNLQRKVLRGVLVLSVLVCVSIYSQYFTDSRKQDAIIRELSNPQIELSTRAVMFQDNAQRFNARGRSLYHWEYLGMLKEAGRGYGFEILDRGGYPCDSDNSVVGTIIEINATSGRLRTILTGNPRLTLSERRAEALCGPGLTALPVHELES
jgi:hypothetical protein